MDKRAIQSRFHMSLGISVNRAKVGALVAYLSFLMPNIQLRKLLKMVYLIDEESVRRRAIPLTWLDYYAWKKGPVAPEVYDLKKGAFSDFVSCKEINDKWRVSSVKTAEYLIKKDMSVFSEWECSLIDEVYRKYGEKDADELTDETHQENSLWSQVVKENCLDFSVSPKSDYKIDLNRLNDSDEAAQLAYEDAFDALYMQSLVNQSKC